MSDLHTSFQKAALEVKSLKQKPSNDELLHLYAFYKQGTDGEITGSRPGLFDLKGRAKFDAWTGLKGTPKDTAMKKYIDLVQSLKTRYGVQT